jgi:hypothetical protein
MSKEIREQIDKVKKWNQFLNECHKMDEGIFDRFKNKDNKPIPESPKQPHEEKPKTYYDVFKTIENDSYNLPIMFCLLKAGFEVNTKYGNPKINYYAFDVRSYNEIMNLIYNNQSFIKMVDRHNQEFKVVGLALDYINNTEVNLLSHTWKTSGRDGFVFAIIENNKEIIDYILQKTGKKNIDEILINEAIKSAKPYFSEIKNWTNAFKIPNA